ncbi:MAG: carbohydrate-binding family 9-like protein [Verrucomicrobia bacterium]|nr:carbohydrate-binding family 9-like protein [Verrucomicrobiota bacterium]MDA1067380.1 carbohydrate-binding family 9-like protein [Verrucomicrobiota bacterium]
MKHFVRITLLFFWTGLTVACTSEKAEQPGHNLKTHAITYTDSVISIDGQLNETAWLSATSLDVFEFPWWEAGRKEQTQAKLLWDDQYLYVSFICEDAHIWGDHTERDSPVYLDDCVEVFTSPNPDTLDIYFNLEMNVLGQSLDHIHPEGPGSKADWDPEVKIATTVDGTLNDDSDIDRHWILEVAIPFASFSQVAKHTPPEPGDEWRLNLNRLGGKSNFQKSQWSPSIPENTSFHAPQFFGRVTFAK